MDLSLEWLLEESNPAIKYRTLTEIENVPWSPELEKLYASIWESKEIHKMLKKQDASGLWSEKDYGSFTSLRYLTAFSEFGLHKDKRIDDYVEWTICSLIRQMKEDATGCHFPLLLRALVMLGYYDQKEIRDLIQLYTSTQLSDGGFMCQRLLDKKPQRKSCYKASLDALLLFAECRRKGIILDGTSELIQYFTKRDVFYSSDHSTLLGDSKQGWRYIDNFFPVEPLRMGLPLIVSALAILGVGEHTALKKAWNFLNEKETEEGQFILEGTLSKQPCSFGKVGQPNKWISFYAQLAKKYTKAQNNAPKE